MVGGAAAGLSDVVPVHRAAQVQVAVGIEVAHEAARVGFEVAFDLELQSEWVLVVAAVRIQAHAAETAVPLQRRAVGRSEEHTSELQSLMRISYAVFCLKKKNKKTQIAYKTTSYE